jgi:hypothetical protein
MIGFTMRRPLRSGWDRRTVTLYRPAILFYKFCGMYSGEETNILERLIGCKKYRSYILNTTLSNYEQRDRLQELADILNDEIQRVYKKIYDGELAKLSQQEEYLPTETPIDE